MKKQTLILIFAVMLLAVAGVIWSRVGVEPPAKGSDIALLIDNSSSENLDCAAVAALASSQLKEITVGKASHLMLFTLGDASNSYEPKPELDLPLKPGPGGIRKATHAVAKACGSFGVVNSSSIFRATELLLGQLQTRGLNGSKLVLQSDLEENVDKRVLHKATKKTALLNNTGIKTLICGYAVTNMGSPRGEHADKLLNTWRSDFAEPKQVTFEPFCPGQGSEHASR